MVLYDLRYAIRTFRKSPAFIAAAVLTLGLGIGANTAVFTLIHSLLLRPLPVKDPASLALFRSQTAQTAGNPSRHFTHPMYLELARQSPVFEGLAAFMTRPVGVTVDRSSERLHLEIVSGNYFQLLGVKPALGRLLSPDDDRQPVAVLSYNYWQRRFGADPSAIGQTIRVSSHPFTIVGVSERSFFGLRVGESPDVRVPLGMEAQTKTAPTWLGDRDVRWLRIAGRLKPGIALAQAQSATQVLFHQLQEIKQDEHLILQSAATGYSDLRASFATPLRVILGLTALVLLISCANLANLLLARSVSRTREVAVRLAIGAGAGRLVRQFLTESLLIALAGGGAGLVLAPWAVRALLPLFPRSDVTFYLDTSIDAGVLAFTAAVSVLTGLLFGLAPALQARKTNLVDGLKAGAQAPSGLTNIWGQGLITGQVALSVVALVAAALFVRTLSNLRAVDAGFSRDHLLLASLDPSSIGWRGAQIADFYRRLLERVETLPEVRSASLARVRVLAGVGVSDPVAIRGYQPVPQENMNVLLNAVSPGYFATLGIPLKAGRDFALTDRLDSPGVAIVNEAFIKRFFPNENPIGRRVSVGNPGDLDIVGVVRDSKYGGLDHPIESTVYISVFQRPDAAWRSTLHIRFRGDTSVMTGSVQALMRSLEPDLPLFAVRTMEAEVDNLLSRERMMALLSALFGALALLIAAIGIYGVLTFAVLRRTKEIGIRMALGARPGQMVGQVVMESLRPVALGLVLGAAAALAVGRLSAGLLFGVSERDPAAFTLAAVTLLAAALLAAYLPARRAAKTDPMLALRQE